MCPRKVVHQQITRAAVCLPYKTLFRVMLTFKLSQWRKKHIDFILNDVRAPGENAQQRGGMKVGAKRGCQHLSRIHLHFATIT